MHVASTAPEQTLQHSSPVLPFQSPSAVEWVFTVVCLFLTWQTRLYHDGATLVVLYPELNFLVGVGGVQ